MRKSTFRKHLEQLDEQDLKDELNALYDRFEVIRTYYGLELGSDKDRSKLLNKAKKAVAAKYATKSKRRPRRPRIQKANAVIKQAAAQMIFEEDKVALYAFAARTGAAFCIDYNFHSEVLYRNIAKNFGRALDLMRLGRYEPQFEDELLNIMSMVERVTDLHIDLDRLWSTL